MRVIAERLHADEPGARLGVGDEALHLGAVRAVPLAAQLETTVVRTSQVAAVSRDDAALQADRDEGEARVVRPRRRRRRRRRVTLRGESTAGHRRNTRRWSGTFWRGFGTLSRTLFRQKNSLQASIFVFTLYYLTDL